jgi:hypothetical protein
VWARRAATARSTASPSRRSDAVAGGDLAVAVLSEGDASLRTAAHQARAVAIRGVVIGLANLLGVSARSAHVDQGVESRASRRSHMLPVLIGALLMAGRSSSA